MAIMEPNYQAASKRCKQPSLLRLLQQHVVDKLAVHRVLDKLLLGDVTITVTVHRRPGLEKSGSRKSTVFVRALFRFSSCSITSLFVRCQGWNCIKLVPSGFKRFQTIQYLTIRASLAPLPFVTSFTNPSVTIFSLLKSQKHLKPLHFLFQPWV